MQRLGVQVDLTKSNVETAYTELMQVEAFGADGQICAATGTLIGMVGTLLGRDQVNIAAMSLSRNNAGGTALCVPSLDSVPSAGALKELTSHRAIKQAVVINL